MTASTARAGEPVHNASRRSIVRNVASSYGVLVVSLVTGLLLTPLLLRELGQQAYGAYVLVGGLVAYLALADLGVGTATTNRIARLRAEGDDEGLNVLLATSFWLYGAASALAILTAGVLALQLGEWFNVPAGLLDQARTALLVLASASSLALPLGVYGQVLVGAGRFDLTAARTVFFSILSSVLQVVAVLNGAGIAWIAVITASTSLLGVAVLRAQALRRYPHVRLRPSLASREVAGGLLRTGSRNVVISLAGMASFMSDLTVLAALAPLSAVAAYAVASKLVAYVRLLSSRLIDVLMPVFAHEDQSGRVDRQEQLTTVSLQVSLLLCLPLTVCCLLFPTGLLRAWLGDVPSQSDLVVPLLALAGLAQLPGHVCYVALTAVEKTRGLLKLSLASAVVNVLASVLLTLRFGTVGPALGTLSATVVADLLVLPVLTCREMGWRYGALVRAVALPLTLPTLVALGVGGLLRLGGDGAVLALVGSGTVCLAFFAVAWRTVLERDQRVRLVARLRRRTRA